MSPDRWEHPKTQTDTKRSQEGRCPLSSAWLESRAQGTGASPAPSPSAPRVRPWAPTWLLTPAFLSADEICDYFGVKIAMYFAWLGFYTSAMVYPAVFGSILYTFTENDQVRVLRPGKGWGSPGRWGWGSDSQARSATVGQGTAVLASAPLG